MAGPDFIENPRKVPRVMVQCPVGAIVGQDRFDSSTVDLGPRGCQLVVPRPHPRGTLVALLASSAEAETTLQATGIVAWSSPHAPYRLGVAFGPSCRPAAAAFFDQVVAARPSLAGWRQVPTRIQLDSMVWLARPPSRLVDFTPDEVAVLRAVGTGCPVFELRARLRGRWSTALGAVFSLLASGFTTLSQERAGPFSDWAGLLNELEAEIAVRSLDDPMAGLAAAAASVMPPSLDTRELAPTGHRRRPSDGAAGLDLDPSMLQPPEVGGPGLDRPRPPEAEEVFERAMAELRAGRPGIALTLLRRALALAPGDAEIARVLGETAFLSS
jgi:hypothetical protein